MFFQTPGYEDMELSTQLIIKEAFKRDIKVDIIDRKANFIRLTKNGKVEYLQQATRTSADTYIAPLLMGNKVATKKVLAEKGIKVPQGKEYHNPAEAVADFSEYQGLGVVVKPNTTNFGMGIKILKSGFSEDDYKNALEFAFQYDDTVLVEEFIEGKEFRFLLIGEEVVAILHRIPANVVGDGTHSIRELIEEKNKNPLRGKGYKRPLEKIDMGDTEKAFLEKQGKNFDMVPGKDETVYLRKNSNISTGGDSIDFTDQVHEGYKKLAIEAMLAAGARITGADIIIHDIKEAPDENNYGIIELNFNPAIHIHTFPAQGKDRKPAGKVLNLLGF